jgi:hypothetical protein
MHPKADIAPNSFPFLSDTATPRPDGSRWVPLSKIAFDSTLWIRKKYDDSALRRYADAIKAGSEFPPIELAEVNGVYLMVDGWHRAEALRLHQQQGVFAKVSSMSREEVQWGSAWLNLKHGVPLKLSDRRRVFGAYVKAGRHKTGRSRYKTYREMGDELGMPFSTLRNWMRKDHSTIYEAIGDKCPERSGPADAGLRDIETDRLYVAQAKAALENAINMADLMRAPLAVGELIVAMEEGLSSLRARRHERPADPDENPNF